MRHSRRCKLLILRVREVLMSHGVNFKGHRSYDRAVKGAAMIQLDGASMVAEDQNGTFYPPGNCAVQF
jgi:hypothetical protein